MTQSSVAIGFLLAAVLCAPTAAAQEGGDAPPATAAARGSQRFELAFLAGGGPGRVKDPDRTSTSVVEGIIRLGINLPAVGGQRRGSAFGILIEAVPYFTVEQDPRATGAGLNLMFRYQYAGERWRPMVLFGAGLVKTDGAVPPGEVTRNYTPQGGVGLQYMLTPGFGIDLEYRFHHLSNNNQTETNPGMDSQHFLFGIFWSL